MTSAVHAAAHTPGVLTGYRKLRINSFKNFQLLTR